MKSFVVKTLLFSTPVILLLVNFILLDCVRDREGDIARMDYIFFEKGYHDRLKDFDTSYHVFNIEIDSIPDSCDVLCFGDSFSGLSPYRYQEPIGISLNTTILNVLYNKDYSPDDAALSFLTYASQNKLPKLIIVENIERAMVPWLYWLNFDNPTSLDAMSRGKKHSSSSPRKHLDEEMLNYYQRLTVNEPKSIRSCLDEPFFSEMYHPEYLYSYYEDTIHYTDIMLNDAVKNICRLHQLAAQRNVKLVFLAVPNKSTLYANHIIDNKVFFTPLDDTTLFDTMPFAYNALPLLRQLSDNDTLDIFFADDTHWTPKTAQAVGLALSEIIRENNFFTTTERQ